MIKRPFREGKNKFRATDKLSFGKFIVFSRGVAGPFEKAEEFLTARHTSNTPNNKQRYTKYLKHEPQEWNISSEDYIIIMLTPLSVCRELP